MLWNANDVRLKLLECLTVNVTMRNIQFEAAKTELLCKPRTQGP